MSHETQSTGDSKFTREESKNLARLLKHPKIAKMLEEVANEEDNKQK